MLNDNFFWLFIMAHLIGDYVLQTGRIAGLKSRKLSGVLLHSVIVAVAQMALLSVFGLWGIAAGLAGGAVHFFIDWLKLILKRIFYSIEAVYFMLDQALHLAVILLLCSLLAGKYPAQPGIELPGGMLPGVSFQLCIKLAIIVMLALFVVAITVKTISRDIYPSLKKKAFFARYERAIDTAALVLLCCADSPAVFAGISFLTLVIVIAFAALLFIPYLKLQRKFTGFNTSLIIVKFSMYAAAAIAVSILLRNTLASIF